VLVNFNCTLSGQDQPGGGHLTSGGEKSGSKTPSESISALGLIRRGREGMKPPSCRGTLADLGKESLEGHRTVARRPKGVSNAKTNGGVNRAVGEGPIRRGRESGEKKESSELVVRRRTK